MPVFTSAVLEELERLPGASHSFLKQAASEAAEGLRDLVDAEVDAVAGTQEGACSPGTGAAIAERWGDMLASLDNRRFFQALSEVLLSRQLRARGWVMTGLERPGPLIAMERGGTRALLMTLAFIRQHRPVPDQEVIQALTRALDRVGSRTRTAVHVRSWLPHAFDPEPVRRAIDLWLREVDRGGWDGRYAAYEDDGISLEFALTGEQAHGDQGVVAFALPPAQAHHARAYLEGRLVYELDNLRASTRREEPLVVACIGNTPWGLTRGHLRELLLGKPRAMCLEGGQLWVHVPRGYAPAVFRDPHYENVSAVIMGSRHGDAGLVLESWMAPFARQPLPRQGFPGPWTDVDHHDGQTAVITRFTRD